MCGRRSVLCLTGCEPVMTLHGIYYAFLLAHSWKERQPCSVQLEFHFWPDPPSATVAFSSHSRSAARSALSPKWMNSFVRSRMACQNHSLTLDRPSDRSIYQNFFIVGGCGCGCGGCKSDKFPPTHHRTDGFGPDPRAQPTGNGLDDHGSSEAAAMT